MCKMSKLSFLLILLLFLESISAILIENKTIKTYQTVPVEDFDHEDNPGQHFGGRSFTSSSYDFCQSIPMKEFENITERPRVILAGFSDKSHYLILETNQTLSIDKRDWYVFESNLSYMIANPYAVKLDTHPLKLEKKWPRLAEHKFFRYSRPIFLFALTLIDSKSSYILFVNHVGTTRPKHFGVVFNLKTEQVEEVTYGFLQTSVAVLPTDTLYSFYALETNPLRYTLWKFSTKSIVIPGIMKPVEGTTSFLCKGQDNSEIFASKEKCAKPMRWGLKNGYVFRGRFYIFTSDNVFIFDDFKDKVNIIKKIQTMSYDSYFNCNPKIVINKKSKKNFTFVYLLSGLLVLLLITLIIILMLYRAEPKKPKNKVNKKEETAAEQKKITVDDNGSSIQGSQPTNRSSYGGRDIAKSLKPASKVTSGVKSMNSSSSLGKNSSELAVTVSNRSKSYIVSMSQAGKSKISNSKPRSSSLARKSSKQVVTTLSGLKSLSGSKIQAGKIQVVLSKDANLVVSKNNKL